MSVIIVSREVPISLDERIKSRKEKPKDPPQKK